MSKQEKLLLIFVRNIVNTVNDFFMGQRALVVVCKNNTAIPYYNRTLTLAKSKLLKELL